MKTYADDAEEWNAESQQQDHNSVLNYWKQITAVRKANHVLVSSLYWRLQE